MATKFIYTLAKALGAYPVGTSLTPSATCSSKVYLTSTVYFDVGDSTYVLATPVRTPVLLPLDNTAFSKIQEAVGEALEDEVFAYGESYLFYQMGDNTWRKAKMEKTSSDFGRVVSGFALSTEATPKQKFNRLTNLNKAYGLGLTVDEIRDARDGVNN